MDNIDERHALIGFTDGKGTFSFQIKLSENRTIDKDTGYLYCKDAIFGHTGVQEYYASEIGEDGNKIVKVHRLPEDVFSDEAMASIEGKSVTRLHPDEMVNSKNYKYYDVGTILKVWQDGENVLGNIVIKDMETIEDITEHRLEALSLGYTAKLIDIGDGEYKQTNITVNHLAVVKKGRAENARIMDEAPDTIGKEAKKMGLFDWIFGKRIKAEEDGTFRVLRDEDTSETETEEDPKDKIEVADSVQPAAEEQDNQETHEEQDGDETEEQNLTDEKGDKDIIMTDEQKKALMDEMRAEIIKEMKTDPDFKKTVFGDVVLEDGVPHDERPEYDFEQDEKLRIAYYDMLTNPTAHGGDWKSLENFRKRATQQVRY
ncbi:MAG: DUF2213 domain-containing protein [Candidatus Izemoplasmatales bacterium]|nr:DUF2213 domain-containing protein [Candidatus Izemoplasmatales bacterium]